MRLHTRRPVQLRTCSKRQTRITRHKLSIVGRLVWTCCTRREHHMSICNIVCEVDCKIHVDLECRLGFCIYREGWANSEDTWEREAWEAYLEEVDGAGVDDSHDVSLEIEFTVNACVKVYNICSVFTRI